MSQAYITTPKGEGEQETVYFFILLGLSKVVAYILLLVLANWFILPDYGKASYVLSAFKLAILFGGVGLPFIFVPWLLKKKDVSSIFYFLLLFNLGLVFIGLIPGIKYPWILPLVFVIPLVAISGVSNSILRVKHKYHIIQLIGVLLEVTFLISVVALASYKEVGIVSAQAIAFYITTLLFIYLTRKELWKIAKKMQLNTKVVFDYVKKGTITTSLYLSFAFLNWTDSLILGYLSTFENVARYNIAGPVSNVVAMVPISLAMYLLTRESEVKSKKKSKEILKSALRISFSFSLLLSIFMMAVIFPAVKLFFPKYIGIELFVMILTGGIVLYAFYSLVYVYQTGKLQPEKVFWPIFLAALINIGLDIMLIPKYGLLGITSATLMAHGFAFLTLTYKMGLLKEFSLVLPMLLMLPLTYYVGLAGILLIPLTLGILYLLKLLTEEDIFVVVKTVFKIFEKFK